MINIKIHRGTSQIGGTITELYTTHTHLFIDFGSELAGSPEDSTDEKMVEMLKNSACDAVLFSHYHGDHVGLLQHIPKKDVRGKEIRLGIGSVARQVLVNIHETLVGNERRTAEEEQRTGENQWQQKELLDVLREDSRWIEFTEGKVFDIGEFHITTIRVDHSAFDAYMFLIEAEGACIVHTGDFRTHGRFGRHFFERLEGFLRGKRVDVLLIEETMMGRGSEQVLTEEELQKEAVRFLSQKENKYAFLLCSSTNMESLASFHNAVMQWNAGKKPEEKRAFYVNRYVKKQLELYRQTAGTEDKRFWFQKAYLLEGMNYYNPKLGMTQLEFMKKNGFLMLIGTGEGYRKYLDVFREENPVLIYSLWKGYVENKETDTYDARLGELYWSMRHKDLHTSGHAVKEDIERMILLTNPVKAVIPIHTEHQKRFKELDIGELAGKVVCLRDGEIYRLE